MRLRSSLLTDTASERLPQDVDTLAPRESPPGPAGAAELKAALTRLAPAWVELRSVLNELNGVLGP